MIYIDKSDQKKYRYSISPIKNNNISAISESLHVDRPYNKNIIIDETEIDISQGSASMF